MDKFIAHILVVDDDEGIRSLVKKYLNENKYIVNTAESAEDALEKIKIIKFDLIILDIMMPGKSGLEFINEHKKKLDTPIILLTAKGQAYERVEGLQLGADDYLAKIIKTEKHPNADRLKVCDVDVGNKEIKKVVCGAANAREGLLTVYAPPGAIIPKNKTKLVVAKIRDVTSYGMLCSESELNLSDESDGIIELKNKEREIGKSYFKKNSQKAIDISITRYLILRL